MADANERPVFLELQRIRLPVTAVVSIGHRVTGVLLFVLLPFVLYLFETSLSGPEGFARAGVWLNAWPVKLATVLAFWWFGYHLVAGLRLLLADWDVGTNAVSARQGAWLVLGSNALIILAGLLLIL